MPQLRATKVQNKYEWKRAEEEGRAKNKSITNIKRNAIIILK